MTGMILDGVLMILLVAALGYGVRLEKKLAALRAGQLAFASAVVELNTAAGRAEAALASLRDSGHETDLLHDRIIKAREVKAQLEALIARGPAEPRGLREEAPQVAAPAPRPAPTPAARGPVAPQAGGDAERDRRMAALAERITGQAPAQAQAKPRSDRDNLVALLSVLTANQSAKDSVNRARRTLDEDLFAA